MNKKERDFLIQYFNDTQKEIEKCLSYYSDFELPEVDFFKGQKKLINTIMHDLSKIINA